MPGWSELSAFSALAALLCGTLTALSFWGIGRLCGRLLAGMHDSVRVPAECIAGVLIMSLAVQALAVANASRPGALETLWIAAVGVGGAALVLALRRRLGARTADTKPARPSAATFWWWTPAGVLGAALLLAAAAPETRSDELAYHLPATARLYMDGGLRFHALPWEASVVPQLAWHYALAPVYAVAGAAAGGVVSAWLALLLAVSVARLVRWQTASAALGAVAAFVTLAGGYPFIFFSTAGPHAFGYLAVFTGMAAVAWSAELRREADLRAYVVTVAVAVGGAIAGKITMLPVLALIIAMAARDVWAHTGAGRQRMVLLAQLLLIPAVSFAPLLVWTWMASGSPLGVLTARLMHGASFDPQTLAAYDGTRELFASRFAWRFESAYWSLPLIVCALGALLLEPARERRLRLQLIAGCQVLVIVLLLPKEVRHLGGVQYPLLASGLAAFAGRWRAQGRTQGSFAVLTGVAALPWALFVLWITSIYVPLASGRLSAAQFAHRYAGLQADYEELDRRLPADAKLLIGRSRSDPLQYGWYARPPVYYAPRPVLFDTAEVTRTDHVYLLYLGAGAEGARGPIPLDPWLPPGYRLGDSVYANPQARFYPSRTPTGGAGLARLEVFELAPAP